MDAKIPDPSTRVSVDDSLDAASLPPAPLPMPIDDSLPTTHDTKPNLRLTHDDFEEEDFVGELVDESSPLADDEFDTAAMDIELNDEAWEEAKEPAPMPIAENEPDIDDPEIDAIAARAADLSGLAKSTDDADDPNVIDLTDEQVESDEPYQMSFDEMFGQSAAIPRPIANTPATEADKRAEQAQPTDPVVDAKDVPSLDELDPDLVVAEVPSKTPKKSTKPKATNAQDAGKEQAGPHVGELEGGERAEGKVQPGADACEAEAQAELKHDHWTVEGDDALATCEIAIPSRVAVPLGPHPLVGFDPDAYRAAAGSQMVASDVAASADEEATTPNTTADPADSQPADPATSSRQTRPVRSVKVLNPTPMGLALAAAARREESTPQAESNEPAEPVAQTQAAGTDAVDPVAQPAATPAASPSPASFEPDWQWRLRGRKQLAPLALGCRITATLSLGVGLTIASGFVMSSAYGPAAVYGLASVGLATVSWTVATMADIMRDMCRP